MLARTHSPHSRVSKSRPTNSAENRVLGCLPVPCKRCLALVNGGKYTVSDIRSLGITQIILGVIGLFLPGYGLEFWALGFGVLHIVYGVLMYRKYESA